MMKQCILLAAVAGIAASQMTWTTSTTTNIYTSPSVTLDLVQIGDLAYTTIYNSGVDPVKGAKWHYESYGVRAWCNGTFTLKLNILSFYSAAATVTVNLFDITPVNMIVKWYRPENAIMETYFDSGNT